MSTRYEEVLQDQTKGHACDRARSAICLTRKEPHNLVIDDLKKAMKRYERAVVRLGLAPDVDSWRGTGLLFVAGAHVGEVEEEIRKKELLHPATTMLSDDSTER